MTPPPDERDEAARTGPEDAGRRAGGPENGREETDDPTITPFDAAGKTDPGPGPIRERLRNRLGLGRTGWNLLVSAAIALPYPVFVYVWFQDVVPEPIFLGVTLAYSLFAIYVSFTL